MIQTPLIKASSAQAGVADPRRVPCLSGEGTGLPPQEDAEAAFADAMARAQRVDPGMPVSQEEARGPLPGADAKSLAASQDETPGEQDETGETDPGAAPPPVDFLQQLQASLRQDVSLITPLAPDGKTQPPESGMPGTDRPAASALTPSGAGVAAAAEGKAGGSAYPQASAAGADHPVAAADEGRKRIEMKAEGTPKGASPGDERARAEAEAVTAAQQPAASPSGASAAPVTPSRVQVASRQALARSEPRGPQASLGALSTGIQQRAAEPVIKGATVLKPVDVKQKPAPGEITEAKATGQGEPGQSLLPAQQPAQGVDSKPEVAARRDAPALPHLRLAQPQAPEQLQQRVNLMLADRLQQAEIQLDPLGLGKMKIQIQLGADSQANVHFVVQHGQTREMLEQAMPRLRDMLAGQGIQLGQTLVQQQVQQQAQQQQQPQSQGQSAFNGQGQQGQREEIFGGNDRREADGQSSTLSLLVESASDAGIDFYA